MGGGVGICRWEDAQGNDVKASSWHLWWTINKTIGLHPKQLPALLDYVFMLKDSPTMTVCGSDALKSHFASSLSLIRASRLWVAGSLWTSHLFRPGTMHCWLFIAIPQAYYCHPRVLWWLYQRNSIGPNRHIHAIRRKITSPEIFWPIAFGLDTFLWDFRVATAFLPNEILIIGQTGYKITLIILIKTTIIMYTNNNVI